MQTDYILHLDADSFFASCEQAMHPSLEGRAVITGAERGIVSSASYEAKRCGVNRGTPLWEVKRIIPSAVVVASDYESYSIFSRRMFSILKKYVPFIEEYSIDEAFGLVSFRSFAQQEQLISLAKNIQRAIHSLLGIPVSIGIGRTKVIAKLGSKYKKPKGVCVLSDDSVPFVLTRVCAGDVWGIGEATVKQLHACGIDTAWDFFCMERKEVEQRFTRPIVDVWDELHGISRIALQPTSAHAPYSIQKVRTFSPPSSERNYVFSQLAYNLENACIKARRYSLLARRLGIYLRSKDYREVWKEIPLRIPSAEPNSLIHEAQRAFDALYVPRELYRSAGIVLSGLIDGKLAQASLFENKKIRNNSKLLWKAIDALQQRYGKHTVMLGASLPVRLRGAHRGARALRTARDIHRLVGESERKRLHFPFFFVSV